MSTSAPIFSWNDFFRYKIFENNRWSVSLSFKYVVWDEVNHLISHTIIIAIICYITLCWGTSWTVHEISVKIFETWSEKQSRMANICLFQMSFSQWRAAQIIFVFSRLFLYRTLTLCTQNFKVHWPALHVFCNIFSHFVENIAKNDICHKI